MHTEEQKPVEAEQPLLTQKLSSQDRKAPVMLPLSAQSIPPPQPRQIVWFVCQLVWLLPEQARTISFNSLPLNSVLPVFTNIYKLQGILAEKEKNPEDQKE